MTLDAAAYDAWFDQPWGRYAFSAEQAALLEVTGPLAGQVTPRRLRGLLADHGRPTTRSAL